MTVDEIVVAALARATEFSDKVPSTKSVYMARIQARQEQLFARIASLSREYAGRDGVLALVGGAADTVLLNPRAMRITDVQIAVPGTSAYTAGERVNLVPAEDIESGLPPRMTLRDGVLKDAADDLTGVTSIRVFYARRPTAISDLAQVPESPEQYHELYVIDLAKSAIRKTLGLAATARKDVLDLLTQEEDELLADFDAHLRSFNYAETSRFGPSALGSEP